MNVLVLNCGSSSIKYQLFKIDKEHRVLAKGQVDRIGIEGSNIEQKVDGKDKIEIETA
ncbi:MAG: acetate kinase, partial [Prolixibacteraceae bacterium]|nr:acetate kinase [Prolixibacteraceae bacterium]